MIKRVVSLLLLVGNSSHAMEPSSPPKGCTVMGNFSTSPVSDISLLQSLPGWRKFLSHVTSDLGLNGWLTM